MVLYLIGLGLGDEKDITLNGLEAIKRSAFVFLEHYTAILGAVPVERLEALYGKKVRTTPQRRAQTSARLDALSEHHADAFASLLRALFLTITGDPCRSRDG
jgi:diphthine synthase